MTKAIVIKNLILPFGFQAFPIYYRCIRRTCDGSTYIMSRADKLEARTSVFTTVSYKFHSRLISQACDVIFYFVPSDNIFQYNSKIVRYVTHRNSSQPSYVHNKADQDFILLDALYKMWYSTEIVTTLIAM
uniref:Uncharacterized protein n=1 Tax=Rhizophagus irregularis (strain DAOM 181602 / DAOM 197198 / MUCL 43194) TaxID=747089 RepID=U9TA23_RHIID